MCSNKRRGRVQLRRRLLAPCAGDAFIFQQAPAQLNAARVSNRCKGSVARVLINAGS